jgi:hypothetical protein
MPMSKSIQRTERGSSERAVDAYGNRTRDYFLETVAIAEQDARAAGAIGYTARLFAQLALPYRDPGNITEWRRQNGSLILVMDPGYVPVTTGGRPDVRRAFPYGTVPRLLTTWMATEAVRMQRRELQISGSLNRFLRELGLGAGTGGATGSITRLRGQTTRTLMARLMVIDLSEPQRDKAVKFDLADRYDLWWSKTNPADTEPLFPSTILLSEQFYESVVSAPVPVDMRALKALRGSPLRIDIYTWLTHRMSYLRRPTTVPWEALAVQFGGDYTRLRAFKAVFLKQLDKVRVVYPFANVHQADHGLLLLPSRPHVAPLPKG